MKTLLDTNATLIYSQNNHFGYSIKYIKIKNLIKCWKRNRSPDELRVNEMLKYYNTGGFLPPVLYLANTREKDLVCYDGNHRREVYNKIEDDNLLIIIDVIFDATESDIFKIFTNINKSVQLPLIYTEKVSENILQDIINLVKTYEKSFKAFLSPSSHCRIPNFNRDVLIDNIYELYNNLNQVYSIKEISYLLNILNGEYASGNLCKPHSSFNSRIIEKCKKYNFWLFIYSKISTEHIEKIINRNN